jgi:hypothetical protein
MHIITHYFVLHIFLNIKLYGEAEVLTCSHDQSATPHMGEQGLSRYIPHYYYTHPNHKRKPLPHEMDFYTHEMTGDLHNIYHSTKGSGRGYGLFNVMKIARRYGLKTDIFREGNRFSILVHFPQN